MRNVIVVIAVLVCVAFASTASAAPYGLVGGAAFRGAAFRGAAFRQPVVGGRAAIQFRQPVVQPFRLLVAQPFLGGYGGGYGVQQFVAPQAFVQPLAIQSNYGYGVQQLQFQQQFAQPLALQGDCYGGVCGQQQFVQPLAVRAGYGYGGAVGLAAPFQVRQTIRFRGW